MDLTSNSESFDNKNALQAYGQTLYVQRNYVDALNAFSTALSRGEDGKIGILDNRSATYCKLGDLDLALKDGRQMMKFDKTDARGYLRTAQVLQLKQRFDDALRLYEYALKTIDPKDAKRSTIELLKMKLDRVINPPRQDPFAILPPELVAMVLDYFSLPSLLKLLSVSKRWAKLATSMGAAFSSMNLSVAKRNIPFTAVRAYFRRHSNTIQRATITHLSPDNATKTLTLLSRCPMVNHVGLDNDLASIEDYNLLNNFTGLKSLSILSGHQLSSSEFDAILSAHPALESIVFEMRGPSRQKNWSHCASAPHLQYLIIQAKDMHITDPFFFDSSLKDQMPVLKEMRIDGGRTVIKFDQSDADISGHPCLRSLSLYSLRLSDRLGGLPRSLENLQMSLISHTDRMLLFDTDTDTDTNTNTGNYNLLEGLSNLKALRFYNTDYHISYKMLNKYFSNTEPSPTLTTLILSRCPLVDANNLVDLMKKGYLRFITDLDVGFMAGVGDSTVEVMVDTMPNLKKLNLSYTTVTGYSIKLFADATKTKLETVELSGTLKPISRDAVEYGRSKGINVGTPMCLGFFVNVR
ncbi:hypothetical protein FQN49_006670 [Arthroderma sp. PD_2]|nr:hypothetical protein FQN49_006670 [Arthroderma sp. PD_2]